MTTHKKNTTPDLLGVVRELEEHPYRTVGIALGIGYLLGTRLGAPIVGLVTSRVGMQLASAVMATVKES